MISVGQKVRIRQCPKEGWCTVTGYNGRFYRLRYADGVPGSEYMWDASELVPKRVAVVDPPKSGALR